MQQHLIFQKILNYDYLHLIFANYFTQMAIDQQHHSIGEWCQVSCVKYFQEKNNYLS